MAAPTATTTTSPKLIIDVTGTNVDAGNNDYTISYPQVNLERGFSVITGTLTAMTVTVLAGNSDAALKDITTDLFGVASFSSDTPYVCDVPLQVKKVVVRAARSNAVNAINLTICASK